MKYKNYLVHLLGSEEVLHFLQQFWISADFRRGIKNENDRCCQPESLRLTFLCEDPSAGAKLLIRSIKTNSPHK